MAHAVPGQLGCVAAGSAEGGGRGEPKQNNPTSLALTMGKRGSKLSKPPSVNANFNEQYDYASAVDQFNKICDESEDYIEQGEFEEAFHRYRACAFIMVTALRSCYC